MGRPSAAKLERDKVLKGRPRRTLCAAVRARHQPCPMCDFAIDQALERHPNPHPLSSVVDEWIPRHLAESLGVTAKELATDPANTVELHRLCNGIKSGHWPVTEKLRDRCRTQVAALLHPVIRRW